jgi:preprotein translocase subunit YajC
MMDPIVHAPILGQENLPLPGQPLSESQAAPDSGGGGGGGGRSDPLGTNLIFIIAIMVVAMIVFSFLGQRRDRRKRDAMLSTLKKHDKVKTLGGVIGSILEVKKDVVVLKVDESSNTRITFDRSAIQQVLASGSPNATSPPKEEKT